LNQKTYKVPCGTSQFFSLHNFFCNFGSKNFLAYVQLKEKSWVLKNKKISFKKIKHECPCPTTSPS
jgi:hypothetical protein